MDRMLDRGDIGGRKRVRKEVDERWIGDEIGGK